MARRNHQAIGIDLGTTYSCVSIFQDNKLEIIPNDTGNSRTPSYVAFTNSAEPLIGDSAKDQWTENPQNTIYNVKRLMGLKFHASTIQYIGKYWPFRVVCGESAESKVQVIFQENQETYSPEEVISIFLKRLKEIAQDYLGCETMNVVIAVPATFNDFQRQLVKSAGIKAGMNVLCLLNKPMAAALAHGFENCPDERQNQLIFSLGDGSFDASIITVEDLSFKVRASEGHTHLGGEDFRNRLISHLLEDFQHKYHINISEDPTALCRLKTAVEKAITELSSEMEAHIVLDALYQDHDLNIKVSRSQFEELCADLFSSIMHLLEKAMLGANLSKSDIHNVVLVGRSAQMPRVQQLLQDFFSKSTKLLILQDEAVAKGAAVQAAILSGNESATVKDITWMDLPPLSLCMDTATSECKQYDVRKLELPSSEIPLVYGLTRISYVCCFNVIRRWNWRTNEEKVQFFSYSQCITAIAEEKNEELIVGDIDGCIFTKRTDWIGLKKEDAVRKIVIIGPDHIIVEFKSGKKSILDLESGHTICEFDEKIRLHILRENIIAISDSNSIEIKYIYNLKKSICKRELKHSDMRVEKEKYVLLFNENTQSEKTLTVWNVDDDQTLHPTWDSYCDEQLFKNLIFRDFHMFYLVPNDTLRQVLYSENDKKWTTKDTNGTGRCKGICVNNTVYFTRKFNLFNLHCFTLDRNLNISISINKNDEPKLLTVLNDGLVAIELCDSICIFVPKKNDNDNLRTITCLETASMSHATRDVKTANCKKRLFIGEGDFSYTEALIQKHQLTCPLLPKAITATEPPESMFLNSDEVIERQNRLRERGVTINVGIRAEAIHETFSKNDQFKRIHWNCPYPLRQKDMDAFKPVIPAFFNSCSKIQSEGDRVHVTLMGRTWRQAENPIVQASALNAYRLLRKRRFGEQRYPGYQHKKTSTWKYDAKGEEQREYVFEKVNFQEEYSIEKPHKIRRTDYDYFECSTDEDSSDYYDSDPEESSSLE